MVDLAYIISTTIWIISLLVIAFFSYVDKKELLGLGVPFSNAAMAAVFTFVYLFFIFLVWLFQRRLNL